MQLPLISRVQFHETRNFETSNQCANFGAHPRVQSSMACSSMEHGVGDLAEPSDVSGDEEVLTSLFVTPTPVFGVIG